MKLRSRTPTSKTKNTVLSKYNRLRQKLQLRDEARVVQEQDAREEQPLASEQPLQEEELTTYEDEDEEDPHVGDDETGIETLVTRNKKNQSNHFNRASPMKIVRLCKSMTIDQRKVITDADFGGVLGMKCSKLNT